MAHEAPKVELRNDALGVVISGEYVMLPENTSPLVKQMLVTAWEERDKALAALAPVEKARHTLAQRIAQAIETEAERVDHYAKEGRPELVSKHDYARMVLKKLFTDGSVG